MALSIPYCSLADVQHECGNDDADKVAVMEDCINRASRRAEEVCHRDWTYHNHASSPLSVESGWLLGDSVFFPWPIITLTEVSLEGVVKPTDEWYVSNGILVGSTDWNNRFPFGVSNYFQVKGTFGYPHPDLAAPPPTCPANVRRAVALTAAVWSGYYSRQFKDHEGMVQSVLTTSIPPEAHRLLSGQIRRRF